MFQTLMHQSDGSPSVPPLAFADFASVLGFWLLTGDILNHDEGGWAELLGNRRNVGMRHGETMWLGLCG